jgi:hypothetical protein
VCLQPARNGLLEPVPHPQEFLVKRVIEIDHIQRESFVQLAVSS